MRWTRVVAAIVLLIVAVVVALLIVLNSIDWSRYQQPIVERVEAATGRRLAVEGPLRVHIGLRPGVVVEGVRFQNASWGSQPEMVKVGRLQVQIALWPLLFGRVEVARVVLSDCAILLETDAKGRGNWVFTPSAGQPAPVPAPTTPPESPPGPEASGAEARPPAQGSSEQLLALVGGLVIESSQLVYLDGATHVRRQLDIARAVASMQDPTSPLVLDLDVRFDGEPVEAHVTLGGAGGMLAGGPVDLDLAARAGGAKLTVEGPIRHPLEGRDFALDVTAAGDRLAALSGLAGSSLPDIGPYRLAAKISDGDREYRIEDLDLKVGESSVRGKVVAGLAGPRPRIEADLDSPRLRLQDLSGRPAASPAGAAAPAPVSTAPPSGGPAPAAADPGRLLSDEPLPLEGLGAADGKVSLHVALLESDRLQVHALRTTLALDDRHLVIEPLHAELVGGALDATIALDGRSSPPSLDLRIDLDQLDSGKLLAALGEAEALRGSPIDAGVVLGGRGRSPHALAASSEGELSVEVGTGRIDRAWAEARLGEWAPLVIGAGGKKEPPSLNCAISRFAVAKGVAKTAGMAVDLPLVAVLGSGQVDLRTEKIDLSLEPVVKEARAGLVTPPARIHGTLAAPAFGVDKSALGEKAVGIASALLKGKSVVGGANLTTSAGLDGCEELIAKQGQLTGAGQSKAASQEVKKKLKKQVKKAQKKLEKEGAGELGNALQDLLGR